MVGSRISDAMSDDDVHACNCGATFDTLEELKQHAKESHPDAYEENFTG